jgi:large subunit ribosomal protein L4e
MAAARPTVNVYNAENGEKATEIALPGVFTAPIRKDIVQFVHTNMAKNSRQAYAVNKGAGHQHSAESWGTGRAVSRIPRVSGSGTHRAGQAAFGNMCRSGRMFAPTKTWRKWHRKISVNQRRYATVSALAASAIPALVMARGHKVEKLEEVPLVLSNISHSKKTKDAVATLKAVGAYDDVENSKESRKIRAGKGKMRNRRYVQRRGPLVVYAEEDGENVKFAFRNLPGVELAHVDRLNLLQLAPGGHLGRFCVWSEAAFRRLDAVYGTGAEGSSAKNGYHLPHGLMSNADLGRIINSTEVQAALRDVKKQRKGHPLKKNPLKNLGAMVKLNPYAMTVRRSELLAAEKRAESRKAKSAAKRAAASKAFGVALDTDEFTFGAYGQ